MVGEISLWPVEVNIQNKHWSLFEVSFMLNIMLKSSQVDSINTALELHF